MNTLKRCLGMVLMVAVISPILSAAEDNGVETLRKTSRAFTEVAKKAVPAVVAVQVEQTVSSDMEGFGSSPFDDEFFRRFFGPRFSPRNSEPQLRKGQGSGFIISSDGYILTNNHVVDSADKITVVLKDGRKLEAKVIGTDPDSDVAVIKVEGKDFPTIELGDSDAVEIGEWVIAVGNPFGLAETVTVGVVSAKGRQIGITEGGYEDFIQTDAAINPGNSGGPLLDLDGKAIGMNSAIISQSGGYMGIGLAVPINMAKAVKEQLISGGKVVRGYVGITMNPEGLTPELAESFGYKGEGGVLVTEVLEESPAAKAGLKQGDIITQLNDKPVSGNDYFRNTVSLMAPGTKIKLTVFRDGKEKDITVEVASLSESKMSTKTSEIGTKLGLSVVPVDSDVARQLGAKGDQGVVVAEVTPRSPAQNAGLRPGMIILGVNQVYVNSVGEFNEALKETEQTRSARLLVKTGRMAQYVLLKLEDK
ncbi:MAG: Do family serine endopeptidase [Anaerohalosphaeraceae bacterium]